MEQEAFEPKNELERRLLSAMAGEISGEIFLQEFMDAQVFMPVSDETDQIKGFQRSTRAKPLVIENEEGVPVLVLFTSPERAKPFLTQVPGYGGGLLTEFSWVLARLEADLAVVVNPGWEVGIDIEPDTLKGMRQRLNNTLN